MGLNYKCPECGTALGFEGLCWSCRAKHHREEVNNWSLQEIRREKETGYRETESYRER